MPFNLRGQTTSTTEPAPGCLAALRSTQHSDAAGMYCNYMLLARASASAYPAPSPAGGLSKVLH